MQCHRARRILPNSSEGKSYCGISVLVLHQDAIAIHSRGKWKDAVHSSTTVPCGNGVDHSPSWLTRHMTRQVGRVNVIRLSVIPHCPGDTTRHQRHALTLWLLFAPTPVPLRLLVSSAAT
eukprot:COSAG02_NODE_40369_length_406_cov_0.986971_1_plen_119_part_01